MPKWFLNLWILAQALVGNVGTSVGNVLAYMGITGGYFLASGTAVANPVFPTVGGLNAIDIQTGRVTNTGALNPRSIVIGYKSGDYAPTSPATLNATNGNIIIGASAVVTSTKSGAAGINNILIGNATSKYGASRLDSGQDICIGAGNQNGLGGSNVIIGNSNISGLGTGVLSYGSVIIGGTHTGGMQCPTNATVTATAVGFQNTITGKFLGAQSPVGVIGAALNLGDINGVNDCQGSWIFGTSLCLGSPSYFKVRVGSGGDQAFANTPTKGNATFVDFIPGAGANDSLILLGGQYTADDLTASYGTGLGANTAYSLALADQGRTFVASATNVQIPDNTSLAIITGTTNSAVKLPANPIDGQILKVVFDAAITTVSFVANTGQTVRNAPASGAVTAGQGITFNYNKTLTANGAVANAWYRV